jgi:hypothetical protein
MKKYLLAALSVTFVLALTPVGGAQGVRRGQPPPPKPLPSGDELFAAGTLDGLTYTNRHFGVTFTAPKGWTVIDPALMRKLRDESKSLFRNEKDPNIKRQLEEAVERTTPLFSASRLPAGTGSFNAVLIFAAERVPTAVVKTPHDYYKLMLHSMNVSEGMKAEVVEPFVTKRVGATVFGLYTLRLTSHMGVMLQRQFMALKGPHAYGLVLTYAEESDAAALDEVVRSFKTLPPPGRAAAVKK